jgi:DNA-binding GntR family transcriptional regulator
MRSTAKRAYSRAVNVRCTTRDDGDGESMSPQEAIKPTGTPSWTKGGPGRVAAPLRDQVLTLVRNAILNFDLKPGQRLVERELIEQLGVSRTTVREVIGQLAAEGLVTMIPQKGAVVSVLSVDEAKDIYEMRAALEAMAVRRFVERSNAEHREQLEEALSLVEEAASQTGSDELAAKDRFYEVLLAGADSPALTQILSSLQGRVRILRATSLSAPGRAQQAAAEIQVVVKAILAGDADRAAEACQLHVRNAARTGLGQLAQATDGSAPLVWPPSDR